MTSDQPNDQHAPLMQPPGDGPPGGESPPGPAGPPNGGPAAQATCTACSAPLAPDAIECGRCGAPQAGAPKCVHCGAVSATSPHSELRQVCNVCGSPRVVTTKRSIKLGGSEVDPLQRARTLRRSRSAWRVGGAIGGLSTALIMALTFLPQIIWGASGIGTIAGILIAIPFLLVAILAAFRAPARTKQIKNAVDEAWKSAAKDVAVQMATRTVTAQQLAEALPVGVAQADQLLTQLTVDDVLRADITPEGRIAYSPSMRFAPTGPAAGSNLEARFEQLATEEAAAAEGQTPAIAQQRIPKS